MTTTPSIIWFTAHKCASVYATEILQKLAHDLAMTYVNYEGDLWEAGQSLGKLFAGNDPERINNMLKTTGHIYGSFRQYYPIPANGEIQGNSDFERSKRCPHVTLFFYRI